MILRARLPERQQHVDQVQHVRHAVVVDVGGAQSLTDAGHAPGGRALDVRRAVLAVLAGIDRAVAAQASDRSLTGHRQVPRALVIG